MNVRPYAPNDFPTVAEQLRCLINFVADIKPDRIGRLDKEGDGPAKLGSLLDFLSGHRLGSIFVLEADGVIAGFSAIFIRLPEKAGYTPLKPVPTGVVQELWVEPGLRKSGMGRALMGHAMEFFRENGCGFLEVRALTENHGACGFYEGLGLTPFVTVFSGEID